MAQQIWVRLINTNHEGILTGIRSRNFGDNRVSVHFPSLPGQPKNYLLDKLTPVDTSELISFLSEYAPSELVEQFSTTLDWRSVLRDFLLRKSELQHVILTEINTAYGAWVRGSDGGS